MIHRNPGIQQPDASIFHQQSRIYSPRFDYILHFFILGVRLILSLSKCRGNRISLLMEYAPDKGWAWAVTFAAFVVNLVVTGAGRMSAVLYVAIMESYGVSRRQAITPFTTRSAVKSLLGPIVGILGQHFGVRSVIISGGAASLLGLILCFFSHDIRWITIYFGVFTGIGSALCISLTQLIVDQYFNRNKATASGLSLAGSSVGSIVFPIIASFLLEAYGVQGTFLLMGGIFMHVLPSAIVMKEPPWINKKTDQTTEEHKILRSSTSYSPQQAWSPETKRLSEYCSSPKDCTIISYIHTGDEPRATRYGSVSVSTEKGMTDYYNHTCSRPYEKQVCESPPSLLSFPTKFERARHVVYNFFKMVLKTLRNLVRINISPSFQFIRLSKTASFFIVSPMTTIILDFALDKGIEKYRVVYIISMLSGGELLGRSGLGLITDRNFVSMEIFMGISMILQGVCTATIPLISSFSLMSTAVLIFGLFQGAIVARYPVLVTKYTKSEDHYVAMGSINVLIGIVAFCIPYFVGYFRDTVGSYNGVFLTVSAVISTMGIAWLILPRLFSLTEQKIPSSQP